MGVQGVQGVWRRHPPWSNGALPSRGPCRLQSTCCGCPSYRSIALLSRKRLEGATARAREERRYGCTVPCTLYFCLDDKLTSDGASTVESTPHCSWLLDLPSVCVSSSDLIASTPARPFLLNKPNLKPPQFPTQRPWLPIPVPNAHPNIAFSHDLSFHVDLTRASRAAEAIAAHSTNNSGRLARRTNPESRWARFPATQKRGPRNLDDGWGPPAHVRSVTAQDQPVHIHTITNASPPKRIADGLLSFSSVVPRCHALQSFTPLLPR